MRRITLRSESDFDGWRTAARGLIAAEVRPEEVEWRTDPEAAPVVAAASPFKVPRTFVEKAGRAILHRDPDRLAFLYRVLWRVVHEPGLIERAEDPDIVRLDAMVEAVGHHPPAIDGLDLAGLAVAAKGCRACPLWAAATRTVFGEGPADARIVLVGEQPGDQEDLAGRPFVGPAGQLFDRALRDAGVERSMLYVTNAVKHFSFVLRGKRRLHQTPKVTEIGACRPWVQAEIGRIRPTLVVAMGATAAHSVFGRPMPVQKSRRQVFEQAIGGHRTRVMVTVHPSYLLRLPDEDARQAEYARFVEDLAVAVGWVERSETQHREAT